MKIATARTKIRLGVFVICISALAGLVLLLAGDDVNMFKKTRMYKAHFNNTSGLIQGAPVRIGGVEVGRVTKIVIEAPEGSLVIAATLRVESPYFELVSRNATVALETQGLLGDKFVSLQPGTNSEQGTLPEGEVIRTREAEGVAKIMERSSVIVDQVGSTTQKIDAFASGLPDAKTMQQATADFTESTRALRILMTQMASRDSIIATLNDAESRRRLQASLASLESATAHLDSIASKVDAGQGTLGALVNDRSMYEDVRNILGHIDRGKIARRVFIEAAGDEEKTR